MKSWRVGEKTQNWTANPIQLARLKKLDLHLKDWPFGDIEKFLPYLNDLTPTTVSLSIKTTRGAAPVDMPGLSRYLLLAASQAAFNAKIHSYGHSIVIRMALPGCSIHVELNSQGIIGFPVQF